MVLAMTVEQTLLRSANVNILRDARLRDIPNLGHGSQYVLLPRDSKRTIVGHEFAARRTVIFHIGDVVSEGMATKSPSVIYTVSDTFVHHQRALEYTAESFSERAGNSNGLSPERATAYRARIEYLRADGEIDGVEVNPSSEGDFWKFVNMVPDWLEGSLVHGDDGRLRVMWRGINGNRVNVEVLGDGQVEQAIVDKIVGRSTG